MKRSAWIVTMFVLVFLSLTPSSVESADALLQPKNKDFTDTFEYIEFVDEVDPNFLSVTEAFPPNHESRTPEKDPCGIAGAGDDWVFFFEESEWTNDYDNDEIKFTHVGPWRTNLEVILARTEWKVGGGYGPQDGIADLTYRFGRYAICIDAAPFFNLITLQDVVDDVKQNIKLLRKNPLYKPVLAPITLTPNGKPKLTWTVKPHNGRIEVFRFEYPIGGQYLTETLELSASGWVDKNTDCAKSYTYWVASTNEHGRSLWSDRQSIAIPQNCNDDSTPGTTPTPISTNLCPVASTTPGIILYTDQNYLGKCSHLTTDHPNLGQLTVGDNSVSSIRINGDYQVKLYRDISYGGTGYEEVNSSDPDLDIRSMGGQYSSVKVAQRSGCQDTSAKGVYVYSKPNFDGSCAYLSNGKTDLATTAVGDDDLSSIDINGDYIVNVYKNRDCTGDGFETTHDETNLDIHSLGNQYSCVQVRSIAKCENTDQPGIYLYREKNYTGSCVYITDDVADLSQTAIGDNHLRSIKIVGYLYVRIYKDKNFGEPYEETSKNQSDLSTRSLGDQYSSLRVIRRNAAPYPPLPLFPATGAVIEDISSPMLCWQSGGDPENDAMEYEAFLYKNGQIIATSQFHLDLCWTPTNLASGDYEWDVHARDFHYEQRTSTLSTRFAFTLKAGLNLSQSFILSPSNPVVGESVLAQFAVKNNNDTAITMQLLGVPVRGPDCADFDCPHGLDFQWIENLTLQAGEERLFNSERTFIEPGNYFAQPSYRDANGNWRILTPQRTDLVVSPGLQVSAPLVISPAHPRVGDEVSARFKVKNTSGRPIEFFGLMASGRGPDCVNWDCPRGVDFSHSEGLTLQPGQEIEYQKVQRFNSAGAGYFFEPVFLDKNSWWRAMPLGNRLPMTVTSMLQVIEDLNLSESEPVAGQILTATFKLKNVSGIALQFRRLGVGVKGPHCLDWSCPNAVDFPFFENITLQPNQELQFSRQRSFYVPATGYFAQILFQTPQDQWGHLGSQRNFVVQNGLQMIELPALTPQEPLLGEMVTLRYKVKNTSTKTLVLPRLGAIARGPNCTQWDCSDGWSDFPPVENVLLPPGAEYLYQTTRQFQREGSGYFVDAAYEDANHWWYLVPNNQRVNFKVVSAFQLLQDFILSTNTPMVGEEVEARFQVKNVSGRALTLRRLGVGAKGPNCPGWDCALAVDFPWYERITLQPDEVFTFAHKRIFPKTGSYFGQILFQISETDWNSLGTERRWTVGSGLEVVEQMALLPATPEAGKLVTVKFRIRNAGSRALYIPNLRAISKGPNCEDWLCDRGHDFTIVSGVTLQSNQEYEYEHQQNFSDSGIGYFVDAAIGDVNGWWYAIADAHRLSFSVQPALGDKTPTATPTPTQTLPEDQTPVPSSTAIDTPSTATLTPMAKPTLATPTPMPDCTVSINRAAIFTNDNLVEIVSNVTGASEMQISNDGGFLNATWQPYQNQANWTMIDPGSRIATLNIYVRFRDNEAKMLCGGTIEDDIIYDALPPTLQVTTSFGTMYSENSHKSGDSTIVLNLIATDQPGGSGVNQMQISTSTDFENTPWLPFASSYKINANSASTVMVRVKDGAGNLSNVATSEVTSTEVIYLPLVQR